MINSVNLDEMISYSGIWVALCRYTNLAVMAPAFNSDRAQEQLIEIADAMNSQKYIILTYQNQ